MSQDHLNNTFEVLPDIDRFGRAIYDLVQFYHWEKVSVFFDDARGRWIIINPVSITAGDYGPTSETPFEWRFAGGPIVAQNCNSNPQNSKLMRESKLFWDKLIHIRSRGLKNQVKLIWTWNVSVVIYIIAIYHLKIITRTNGIVCCSEHENIPINMFFDTMKITIFALFGGREQLWCQSDYAAAQTDLICAFAVCKCSK